MYCTILVDCAILYCAAWYCATMYRVCLHPFFWCNPFGNPLLSMLHGSIGVQHIVLPHTTCPRPPCTCQPAPPLPLPTPPLPALKQAQELMHAQQQAASGLLLNQPLQLVLSRRDLEKCGAEKQDVLKAGLQDEM